MEENIEFTDTNANNLKYGIDLWLTQEGIDPLDFFIHEVYSMNGRYYCKLLNESHPHRKLYISCVGDWLTTFPPYATEIMDEVKIPDDAVRLITIL